MFRRRARDHFVLPAEPGDIGDIVRIHAQGFSRGWTREEISELMDRPGVTMLTARPAGEGNAPLTGFNLFRQTQHEAEILSVAVAQRFRRRGVGDALMRSAIRSLQADRVDALFLEVDETNRPALEMYRRLGFSTVGRRPGYYTGSGPAAVEAPVNALVMRLDLR